MGGDAGHHPQVFQVKHCIPGCLEAAGVVSGSLFFGGRMERRIRVVLTPEQANKPLLSILRGDMGISHTLLKRIKTFHNGIVLDGKAVHVDAQGQAGSVLEVLLEVNAAYPGVEPTEGSLDIVYEDADVMVLNKPAGVPIHPSSGHIRDSLANFAAWHFAQRGENLVFRPVNRLDKCTSGLLVAAKTAHAQDLLHKQRQAGLLVREYLALVQGSPVPAEGIVDAPIARVEGSIMLRQVDANGRRAVTHYQILVKGKDFSLLRLWLDTGRTHQIRVHMAHLGHPLVGDFLYGTEGSGGMIRTALHASQLRFLQPMTGKPLVFDSPLPEDMKSLYERVRNECTASANDIGRIPYLFPQEHPCRGC